MPNGDQLHPHRPVSTKAAGGLMLVAVMALTVAQYALGQAAPPAKVELAPGQKVELVEKQAELLAQLAQEVHASWTVHQPRDEDGVPLWYVPRSWGHTQESIVDKLATIAETQRTTLTLLERLERSIDQRGKNP